MGVWIETFITLMISKRIYVTPYVGVWIETPSYNVLAIGLQSHPTWVCGLKPAQRRTGERQPKVTPYVGVWIETILSNKVHPQNSVTPYVGVWIETLL